MGVSHKIYKLDKTFEFSDAYTQIKSLLTICNNGYVMLNARPNSIEAIKAIKEKHDNSIKEIEIQITSEQSDEINKLLYADDKFKFCFIKSPNYRKEEIFGIQTTINYGYKKVNLEINLPYANSTKSKIDFVSFVHAINKELCLGFRSKEQIKIEIEQLIDLHFDKEFYDSSWKLHFGSNIYSSAGTAKEIFENNKSQKFRSTGFRIIFPDNIEKLRPFKEYAESKVSPILNYFKNIELDFHFFSDNSKLIDNIVKTKSQKVKSEIIIDLTENVINEEALYPKDYQGEGQVNFRIEELKPNETDEYYFTLEYYGETFSALEFFLQIDKNASEEYIEKVLELFETKPKFSHLE